MDTQKHRKSLTMSHKLFTDMNNLCDVLGINSHSYILNLIAKEVHKDMVGYNLRIRPSSEIVADMEIQNEYLDDDLDIDPNGTNRAF